MSGDPIHKDAERSKTQALDKASRVTIYRFVFTVGLFLVWIVPQGERVPIGMLGSAMLGSAVITGLLAMFFREPFRDASLNRWDEALAYSGVAALVRALS
jgi:hypothetical protein